MRRSSSEYAWATSPRSCCLHHRRTLRAVGAEATAPKDLDPEPVLSQDNPLYQDCRDFSGAGTENSTSSVPECGGVAGSDCLDWNSGTVAAAMRPTRSKSLPPGSSWRRIDWSHTEETAELVGSSSKSHRSAVMGLPPLGRDWVRKWVAEDLSGLKPSVNAA